MLGIKTTQKFDLTRRIYESRLDRCRIATYKEFSGWNKPETPAYEKALDAEIDVELRKQEIDDEIEKFWRAPWYVRIVKP